MMTEPKFQHIVPKTYLRRFHIDDLKHRNKVWCFDFNNKYQKLTQVKGVDDKIFKVKNFYTNSTLTDKYGLEKFFANQIEPTYNDIMTEVDSEQNLSENVRKKIMQWIFYTKQRSENFRIQAKTMTESISRLMLQFNLNKNKSELAIEDFDEALEDYSEKVAKNLQFTFLYDESSFYKLCTQYYEFLLPNSWTIYKTIKAFPFISSDNPGFSLNWTKFFQERPFHGVIHLNFPAFNFFILSPKYCLYIQPFKRGTDVNINALNMDIRFKEISSDLVDFINFGAYYTSNRFIFSNNQNSVDRWVIKN